MWKAYDKPGPLWRIYYSTFILQLLQPSIILGTVKYTRNIRYGFCPPGSLLSKLIHDLIAVFFKWQVICRTNKRKCSRSQGLLSSCSSSPSLILQPGKDARSRKLLPQGHTTWNGRARAGMPGRLPLRFYYTVLSISWRTKEPNGSC